MTKIDEGRLLAWIDGELAPEDARRVESWVEEDAAAAGRLIDVRTRAGIVTAALAAVDVDPPTRRVAARLRALGSAGPGAGPASTWWMRRSRLAQAAGLVLLLAGGAAAAMPGSPLRGWIERSLGGPGEPVAVAPAATSADAAEQADDVGVWIDPVAGAARIALTGVPDGIEIVVTLVDEGRAGVSAPRGTSLRSGDGWIEATVRTGPVRVDLPRSLRSATVVVRGREYLSMEGGEVELSAPASIGPRGLYRFTTGR